MRHAFIDTYANLDTVIHRLNAKAKVIFWAVFLLVIILTPITQRLLFFFYGAFTLILIYLSKVPANFICKRLANIFPFIILICLSALFKKQGYLLFISCTLKATLATLVTVLLSSTTRFTKILDALKALGVSPLFIYLFSFMYRYSFLLEDQLLRTTRAYTLRSINKRNNFNKIRILSNILGTIFIRTYERAERVYLAMCARGYTDEKSS
jgi:cobalt/nickel transport system permease protein